MAEIENRLEEIDNIANQHWFELTRFRQQGATPTTREHICPNCYESVYLLSLRWAPEKGKLKTKQQIIAQHQALRKARQAKEAKRKAKELPPPEEPQAFIGPPSRQDLIRQWQEKFSKKSK